MSKCELIRFNEFHLYRYVIMKRCWQEAPEKRPTFTDLVQTVDEVLAVESNYCDMIEDETGDAHNAVKMNSDTTKWPLRVVNAKCLYQLVISNVLDKFPLRTVNVRMLISVRCKWQMSITSSQYRMLISVNNAHDKFPLQTVNVRMLISIRCT